MKAVGLIVEYNPMHYGHIYHIRKAKEITKADVVVAVMSPNFTQRGIPSIIDKKQRTIDALNNGVDLVVELPFIYACENSDIFAFGALNILNDLKCDSFVFGSETGETEQFLDKYNNFGFESPRMDDILRKYLNDGYSYPKAKALALNEIHDFYLEYPNDILGYSYIKTINQYNLAIKPISIKRTVSYKGNDAIDNITSAYNIRNLVKQNKEISLLIPGKINNPKFLDDYFDLFKYKVLATPSEQLRAIHLVNEGIENLFKKQIRSANNFDEFISKCTSKRYSGARLTRTIAHILVNTLKEEVLPLIQNKPSYIRILGFNEIGQNYLNSIRKDVTTPILNRFSAKEFKELLLELRASDTYFYHDNQIGEKFELTSFPVVVKNK
ncbi:MAG: nucleotidyltransferase [Bacilli bacterium]|nr:nucleotidyltransferase [Bacilli bacterium]